MSIWRFTSGPSWPLFLLLACTVTFFVIGVWSPSLGSGMAVLRASGQTGTTQDATILYKLEKEYKDFKQLVHTQHEEATAAIQVLQSEVAALRQSQPRSDEPTAAKVALSQRNGNPAIGKKQNRTAAVQPQYDQHLEQHQDDTATHAPDCPSTSAGGTGPLPHAAFVYLLHSGRVGLLVESLQSVFRNFNDQYRYPIIVFHEPSLDKANATAATSAALSPTQLCLLQWHEVSFSFPDGFDAEKALAKGVVSSNAFPGYHHMCSFWFAHVFAQPAIRSLEYYVRLDTDSQFTAPIRYDFIRWFHEQGFEYGYRYYTTDPHDYTHGMWDFLANYTSAHGLQLPSVLSLPPPNVRATSAIPMYFNNFEVVHVPFFTDRHDVHQFSKAVIATHAIYQYRWGDAPLRFLALHLFLDHPDKQIHYFCDIPYAHGGRPCHPICRSPGGNETITLTEQNDCHLGRWR